MSSARPQERWRARRRGETRPATRPAAPPRRPVPAGPRARPPSPVARRATASMPSRRPQTGPRSQIAPATGFDGTSGAARATCHPRQPVERPPRLRVPGGGSRRSCGEGQPGVVRHRHGHGREDERRGRDAARPRAAMRTMREAGAVPSRAPASGVACLVITPARASSSLVVWCRRAAHGGADCPSFLRLSPLRAGRLRRRPGDRRADGDAPGRGPRLAALLLRPAVHDGRAGLDGRRRLPADGADGVRPEAAAAADQRRHRRRCWCGCWCASRAACLAGGRGRRPGSRCCRR